jgi:hypothetical protein
VGNTANVDALPLMATEEMRAALDAKIEKAEKRAMALLDSKDAALHLKACDVVGRLVQSRADLFGVR